ncbi:MAG TPA: carbonic anhydrase [Alphaproteobacteria bacterium]
MGFRKLINGFRAFRHEYFHEDSELFDRLVNVGQSPKVMVIACSDSRIDPAILTRSEPGDIFSVRNIAAMVDANDDSDHRGHATSAAVEYAVKVLKVEHIVIMGHALCGGINALAKSDESLATDNGFIARWISIGIDARDQVRRFFPKKSVEEQSQILEQSSILVSINNLMTYPWVREGVENGELKLHGWYFDIPNGNLLSYAPATKRFENVLNIDIANDAAVQQPCCDASTGTISVPDFLNTIKGSKLARQSCLCEAGIAVKRTARVTGQKIKQTAKAGCAMLVSPEFLTAAIEVI